MILGAPRDENVPPGTDFGVPGALLGSQEPLNSLRNIDDSVKASKHYLGMHQPTYSLGRSTGAPVRCVSVWCSVFLDPSVGVPSELRKL